MIMNHQHLYLVGWAQALQRIALALLLVASSLVSTRGQAGDISPGPVLPLPIVTVIKNEFSGARGWRISWAGGILGDSTAKNWRKIFSTVTGSVNSVNFLNATGVVNTDNADMSLWGRLSATSKLGELNQVGVLKNTKFRLSTWNLATLENAAKVNPATFGVAFEFGFFGPVVTETAPYQTGQIYLFKTDRPQPKYGAVRIVKWGGSETIIEVVVQK